MSLSWQEVIKRKEYKNLSEQEKIAAKTQYFNEVVLPNVPEEKHQTVEKIFHADTSRIEAEQNKVGLWEGFIKPTAKAIPRVAGTLAMAGGAFVGSGLAGGARLISTGSLEEAGKTIEGVGGLSTIGLEESEQKAIETIFKPIEWIQTASKFYGDKVFEKTKSPDLAASAATAFETIAFLGLPKLKASLTKSIKLGKIAETKRIVKEVHQERLRVLQEEPERFAELAKKEVKLRELESFQIEKKSAKESAEFFVEELRKAKTKEGVLKVLEEQGAERVAQPTLPGKKAPYVEPTLIEGAEVTTREPVFSDTEAFLRKAHETITRITPEVKAEYGTKERGILMPKDERPLMGARKEVKPTEVPPTKKVTPEKAEAVKEPITAYHGTNEQIKTFKENQYFTTSKKYAEGLWKGRKGANVVETEIQLNNPKVITQRQIENAGSDKLLIAEAKNNGHDGFVNEAGTVFIVFDPKNVKIKDLAPAKPQPTAIPEKAEGVKEPTTPPTRQARTEEAKVELVETSAEKAAKEPWEMSESDSKHWNLKTTDVPLYDNIMKNPEYFEAKKGIVSKKEVMLPYNYLEHVAEVQGISIEESMKAVNLDTVQKYADAMKRGEKFPILVLEHGQKNQEGRHRALAAQQIGINVPVLSIRDKKADLALAKPQPTAPPTEAKPEAAGSTIKVEPIPKPALKEVSTIKNLLKSERGSIELPDTAIAKHQKAMSKSKEWQKVHSMIGKEKKSFNLSGFATKVNEKLFDRFTQIRKVSQETYNEARIYNSYRDTAKIKYTELSKGLKGVRNDELLFTDYVDAHRALTRAERGLKNPNNVTLQDAKQSIKAMEKEWKLSGRNVKVLKDSFNAFQNWTTKYILDEARDSGMISKQAYLDIKKNNKFYATFEVLDHLPPEINNIPKLPTKEYFSVSNQSIIKKMIGTEKLISNPIEATIRKFTQAQATFARNKVASTLVDSKNSNKFLRPIAMSAKEYAIMKKQGLNPVTDRAWSKKEFGTINRFKDGKLERYIAPIELAEAMKQLSTKQAPKVIQMMNAIFRKSATTLYVPFTISNAMRDAYMAYTTAPVYKTINMPKFAKDWAKGFWEGAKYEFLGKSDLAEAYIKSGGGFGYVGNLRKIKLAEAGLFKKGIINKATDIIKSPLDLIEHISATVELAPRLGVFDRAKIIKFTNKEAALMAKQSTIDFSRGGTWTKVVNQWVPFLNARVQGRVVLANALKRDPGGTLAKIAVSVVVPGALTYAWNRLYFSDLYDDIPEYIRQNYFPIIIGTAKDENGKEIPKYIVISKGDVGQMAWNPIEFGLDKMWKKDREGTGAFLLNYLNDLSPVEFAREGKLSLSKAVGGLTPPIVKGFAEDWANINLYRGSEIVPYYMKKTKPPELQYKENTPASYKWLGKKLKISPLRLQNFASNILAGYGREGLDPSAMLRGLTGRLVKTRGGEKEDRTWVIIKDIEQGYVYTGAYAEELINNNKRPEAIKLLNEWNNGLLKRVDGIEKYGFRDKGGLREAYMFNAEKRRNLLLKRKDDRTALEKRLSNR